MATWDDVARVCLTLPATTEGTSRGRRQWRVRDKAFVWERPLGKKDMAELGDAVPTGPVVAAYVPDEGAKRALIAEEPDVYFTTRHFDGYPAVLCRLEELDEQSLTELAAEAWGCRAPARLLAEHPVGPDQAPPSDPSLRSHAALPRREHPSDGRVRGRARSAR